MTAAVEYLESPQDEFDLACLLLAPAGVAYLGEALRELEPEDFADPVLGVLWASARAVVARGDRVSKRTILAEASAVAAGAGFPGITRMSPFAGQVPGVKAALERISGEPVYPENIYPAITRVRHTARMRRLVRTLETARDRVVAAEDYPEALGLTRELLAGLEVAEEPAEVAVFADLADEFHKTMTGGGPPGEVVPTPWVELNEVFGGGLYPGRLYIVAGRPGAGKSIVGVECARNAAEQGFSSLVISVEMGAMEVTGRVMASGARVEYGEISRYAMSDGTAWGVAEYADSHRDMPLRVCDRADMTVERVARIAEDVHRKHDLSLLVVDYVQLMEASDPRLREDQQLGHISRSLKLLGKRLGCAVVAMAQLNRGNAKDNRRPVITDMQGSGKLEQDADAVVLAHHPLAEDGSPTGMVLLIVGKNRQGKCLDVELRWRGHQARIGD